MKRWALVACVCLVACSASTKTTTSSSTASASGGGGETGEAGSSNIGGFGVGGAGGTVDCGCVEGQHNDVIYTLSSDGEIWSYDPISDMFAYETTLLCSGVSSVYSMAIDQTGTAWIMSASNNLIYTLDLLDGGQCEPAAYMPYQTGFDLFGIAFAGDTNMGACPGLYGHSYSANGPFAEGPDLGELVEIDPVGGDLSVLSTIDYDGGELAGSFDGRLFAFAGDAPSKLVEYDRFNGNVMATTPLDGLPKTLASAFAFFAGDMYFFTEQPPAGCDTCLQTNCNADYQACLADPICAEQLQCSIDFATVEDECGGMMPQPMIDCVTMCGNSCWVNPVVRVSHVTRLDLDGNDGGGLSVVNPQAPNRIVGAGNSVCVPLIPN